LITFAINSSPKKKMTLSEIYQWICEKFPYYKEAGNGWKVGDFSTRINLKTEYKLVKLEYQTRDTTSIYLVIIHRKQR